MPIALWIAQTLLVAIFFITGSIKLTQPRLELAAGPMRWAAEVSDARFRIIGALEVLAAMGLLLASALDAPILSTLAATVVALTMTGAVATHARCGETERIAFPALLLVISIFVALAGQGV